MLRVMEKVNLAAKLAQIQDRWSPRIVAELNGQHVKIVKVAGEFVWHHHDEEDELFLVLEGVLEMQYRDPTGHAQSIELQAGEMIVVPRGVEHRPKADHEAHLLLFEPAGTLNTGNIRSDRTVEAPQRL